MDKIMGIASIGIGLFFLACPFMVALMVSPTFPDSLMFWLIMLLLALFFVGIGVKKLKADSFPSIGRIKGFTPGTIEDYGGPSIEDINFGRETQPKTLPQPEDPQDK